MRAPGPDPIPWLRTSCAGVPTENLRVSAIVLGEIAQGIENNPVPGLKDFLADVRAMLIVEFGEAEALEWGRMVSAALKAGQTVATRNKSDFQKFGVQVFDPWTDKL